MRSLSKRRNEPGQKKNSPETIAAVATPTGAGGIGIIRISGPASLDILNSVFVPKRKRSKPRPYMLRFGRIISHNDSSVLDEVLAVYMPGPRSFTGEDMVEVYCHAGQYTLKAILDNILGYDCRPAEAGEFSLRRFVNHGVDLSKLEGAAEIIAAKTDLAYRLSREHLVGAYGEHIGNLRRRIVHLLAEIEADIDFPDEEEMGKIGKRLMEERLDEIIADVEQLADSYRTGMIVKDGFRVIILGPPNSGKSSLFNRLVRRNRALVTPVPGTTRDYISEWIDIDGLPVELFDTAGLRKGRGTVEKAGIESSTRLIRRADLIIYLYDVTAKASGRPDIGLKKHQQMVIVLNKGDLLTDEAAAVKKWAAKLRGGDEYFVVSAKTGKGIGRLTEAVRDRAGMTDLTDSLVVTSERHQAKIRACLNHLKAVRKSAAMPGEIVSLELRQAADRIGEITGHIYTEEILDDIFSSFCIGK